MLLLDEMLPRTIADHLTTAGCDAEAVTGRPDLVGAPDEEVLEAATREGRVLVTANIRDFVPLSNTWASRGQVHHGLVLISSKTFPMNRGNAGRIAAALVKRCQHDDWPQPGQYDFLHS